MTHKFALSIGLALFLISAAHADRLWERTLYDGIDPFTVPQTKVDWVNSSIPGIKAPRTRCKRMHSRLILYVEGQNIEHIRNAVIACGNNALTNSDSLGLAAAIFSGGASGFEAALNTTAQSFQSCILGVATGLAIKYENPVKWSDWGGC